MTEQPMEIDPIDAIVQDALANYHTCLLEYQKELDKWERDDPNFSREEFFRSMDPNDLQYLYGITNTASNRSDASSSQLPRKVSPMPPAPAPALTNLKSPPKTAPSRLRHTSQTRKPKPQVKSREPSPQAGKSPVRAASGSTTTSPRKVTVNDRVYKLNEAVGRGASCTVYNATDLTSGTNVALKVVDMTKVSDQVRQLQLNEVKFLENLQDSDYVISLIGYEYRNQILYVVMELGQESLSEVIDGVKKNRGGLDAHFIRYYWAEMLRCVQVIHNKNIIHSDLKPANFLMVKSRLKLIDFGIAAQITDSSISVAKNGIFGTLNYMSPEAIGYRTNGNCGENEEFCELTLKSDVWSLACILYALIHGFTPFTKIKAHGMKLEAIKRKEIDLSQVEDADLRDVLKRCFQRDPNLRPTVDELLQHPYVKGPSTNKENRQVDATLVEADFEAMVEAARTCTPRTAMRHMRQLYKEKKQR